MDVTLLLPELKRVAGSAFIARWLLRGDRAADSAKGHDVLLRECFQFLGASVPTASLTRSLDANDAPISRWLRADPAFVMADAVTLRLLACGKMDLSTNEVDALAATLKPLFGDSGFLLEATHPERWYLRCAREAKLPTFSSPDDALGDDLALHLPQGDDARRWRTLLNEVQMTLHDHPVNSARVRRGLPPVNSLWVWGGGVLPDWVKSDFNAVFSDDEVVVALGRLAGIPNIASTRQSLSAEGFIAEWAGQTQKGSSADRWNSAPSSGRESSPSAALSLEPARNLLDLTRERDRAALEQQWFAPIDAALAKRKIQHLNLLFESGERVTLKAWHHWRFWRRPHPTRA